MLEPVGNLTKELIPEQKSALYIFINTKTLVILKDFGIKSLEKNFKLRKVSRIYGFVINIAVPQNDNKTAVGLQKTTEYLLKY